MRRKPASRRLTVEALENRTVPSFLPPVSSPGLGNVPLVGDFNKDARADLVTVDRNNFLVQLSLGNGNGTFQAARTVATGDIQLLAVGDFNRDGTPDIAAAGPYARRVGVRVLLGNGLGGFQAAPDVAFRQRLEGEFDAVAGDFNHDGKLDLAVSGATGRRFTFSFGTSWVPDKYYINVFLGNGQGSFLAPTTTQVDGHVAAAGDFNGDGKLDLLATAADTIGTIGNFSPQVYLLRGNGDGSLQAPTVVGQGYAIGLTAADVNGDGRLDFVSLNGIVLGKGDGTFQTPRTFDLGVQISADMAVGDFNRDGKLDIVTVGQDGSVGEVNVLLGNGDGTFQTARRFDLGAVLNGAQFDLIPADYTGDGWLDLAVTISDYDRRSLAVLLNDRNW